jgi:hypothetical protein
VLPVPFAVAVAVAATVTLTIATPARTGVIAIVVTIHDGATRAVQNGRAQDGVRPVGLAAQSL